MNLSQPDVHGLFITPSHFPCSSCMILWCPQLLHFSRKNEINSFSEIDDWLILDSIEESGTNILKIQDPKYIVRVHVTIYPSGVHVMSMHVGNHARFLCGL